MTESAALSEIDGRRQRTSTTRRRILDACRELVMEGDEPTAVAIAGRIGITRRTLFRHFADIDSLHRETIEQAIKDVHAIMDEPIPDGVTHSVRMSYIIDRRARVYEALFPVFISPVFSRHRERVVAAMSSGAARQRSRVKEALPSAIRKDKRLFDAINGTLSIDYWVNLRRDQHLSKTQTKKTIEKVIEKLVG